MTKKQRQLIIKELKVYIDSHLADIKLKNTHQIKWEMREQINNILTEGITRAINENISKTLQESYEIKMSIGLKAKG